MQRLMSRELALLPSLFHETTSTLTHENALTRMPTVINFCAQSDMSSAMHYFIGFCYRTSVKLSRANPLLLSRNTKAHRIMVELSRAGGLVVASSSTTTATAATVSTTAASTSSTPLAASSPTSSSHSNSAPEPKVEALTAAKGKRVFVFQKRWLHSLPIVEKTLPETAADVHKRDNGSSDAAESTSREVIACMLCEEPAASAQATSASPAAQSQQQPQHHHLVKMWSRTNCRRGRIENHLTSKHPEFMLLLKHKRDSEGELAVQLFLQGMRDGRCSLRNEINLGLYTHIHALNAQANADAAAAAAAAAAVVAADATAGVMVHTTGNSVEAASADIKRAFPGASAGALTLNRDSSHGKKASFPLNSLLVGAGGVLKASLELLECDGRRKRVRLATAEPLDGVLVNGTPDALAQRPVLEEAPLPPSSVELSSALAQWQTLFFSRLVVVTGGDSAFISSLATSLWLLGANVLLMFSYVCLRLEEVSAQESGRSRCHLLRFLLPAGCSVQFPNSAGGVHCEPRRAISRHRCGIA